MKQAQDTLFSEAGPLTPPAKSTRMGPAMKDVLAWLKYAEQQWGDAWVFTGDIAKCRECSTESTRRTLMRLCGLGLAEKQRVAGGLQWSLTDAGRAWRE